MDLPEPHVTSRLVEQLGHSDHPALRMISRSHLQDALGHYAEHHEGRAPYAASRVEDAVDAGYHVNAETRNRSRNPYGLTARPYESKPDSDYWPGDNDVSSESRVPEHGNLSIQFSPASNRWGTHRVSLREHGEEEEAGSVSWSPSTGEVSFTHLEPHLQGKGLGQHMLKHAEDLAAQTPGVTTPLPSTELSPHGVAYRQRWSETNPHLG